MMKSKLLIMAGVIAVCYGPLFSAPRKGWTDSGKKIQALEYIVKNNIKYEPVSFGILNSFSYPMPDFDDIPETGDDTSNTTKDSFKAPAKSPIPDSVRALDGRKVAIQGYVLPLETDDNGNQNFLFVDQLLTCMFCQRIRINGWVHVFMKDKKQIQISDEQYYEPFTAYGTLKVGETYEDGRLTDIYRLDADVMEAEKKGFWKEISDKIFSPDG